MMVNKAARRYMNRPVPLKAERRIDGPISIPAHAEAFMSIHEGHEPEEIREVCDDLDGVVIMSPPLSPYQRGRLHHNPDMAPASRFSRAIDYLIYGLIFGIVTVTGLMLWGVF